MMQEKIFTLKMNGYCCSQIIMEIGLELMEREIPNWWKPWRDFATVQNAAGSAV